MLVMLNILVVIFVKVDQDKVPPPLTSCTFLHFLWEQVIRFQVKMMMIVITTKRMENGTKKVV